MILSSLREPPHGSPIYNLPYVRQLKERSVEKKVLVAQAPYFDTATQAWVTPSAVTHKTETVQECPAGLAGIQKCDIITAVNWQPFLRGGGQLLSNNGRGASAVTLCKRAAVSVLRVVSGRTFKFQSRVQDALRYYRIFIRRRCQLYNAIAHLASTGRAGFLVRALHSASYLPSLKFDDPAFAMAEELVRRAACLPQPATQQDDVRVFCCRTESCVLY